MQQQLIAAVRNGFGAPGNWVLVIGDLMLDRYLWGEVERISPEAPVPVVLLGKETECAGGAANVAANLVGLGLPTRLIGCVGADDHGTRLKRTIEAAGIDTRGILHAENHPTIAKTRIIGGHQQMMRLDRESRAPYTGNDIQALLRVIHQQLAEQPAAVILSDYAKGVLTTEICQTAIR